MHVCPKRSIQWPPPRQTRNTPERADQKHTLALLLAPTDRPLCWPIVDGQLQSSVVLDSFSLFALCSIPHLDSSTGSRLQEKKGPSRLTVHSARLSEGESWPIIPSSFYLTPSRPTTFFWASRPVSTKSTSGRTNVARWMTVCLTDCFGPKRAWLKTVKSIPASLQIIQWKVLGLGPLKVITIYQIHSVPVEYRSIIQQSKDHIHATYRGVCYTYRDLLNYFFFSYLHSSSFL
jgi:hypothetical protein